MMLSYKIYLKAYLSFPLGICGTLEIQDTITVGTYEDLVATGIKPLTMAAMDRFAAAQKGSIRKALAKKAVAKAKKNIVAMTELQFCNAVIDLYNKEYNKTEPHAATVEAFVSLCERVGILTRQQTRW